MLPYAVPCIKESTAPELNFNVPFPCPAIPSRISPAIALDTSTVNTAPFCTAKMSVADGIGQSELQLVGAVTVNTPALYEKLLETLSIEPSQLLSTPSQTSIALGLTRGFASLQSVFV